MKPTSMSVQVTTEKRSIPTYPEAEAEALPMFAENRVHQRTSGRPYPNQVVLKTNQAESVDREYTVITLENEYLAIDILPEIGGRIFASRDKTNGYDFFYRQSVIKPALIGALGSWMSGGVEFNWPFHHRPSTFMPTDYTIEHEDDGAVTVWLSEHDPIDRMKGMVGIRLRPGESILETRVQVANRTPVRRSFLWWENAAVPVNKDYQIFFPQDVSYVNFHYHRSVTTWPKGSGVYNGIRFDEDVDLQQHANTLRPTSYFSAASQYDFFGGYDHGKQSGVVHVANHHIAPGKKLFTWAYNQLSDSWERSLTDTDGEYAELMAGSYTDNQPDFAWLEPYETKKFSQFWFPIQKIGAPCFANTCGALSLSENGLTLSLQTTRSYAQAKLEVMNGKTCLFATSVDLTPGTPIEIDLPEATSTKCIRYTLRDASGKAILDYTAPIKTAAPIPEPWVDTPLPEQLDSAQELYFAGLHLDQYRSPKVLPDSYWKAALQRDPEYIPALVDLGCFRYKQGQFEEARALLEKAIEILTRHNGNPRCGDVFYTLGLTLLALGKTDAAYDAFYKASWNEAMISRSMTLLASIDGQRGDFDHMLAHADNALSYATDNPLACALGIIATYKLGQCDVAQQRIDTTLQNDPLNQCIRYLKALIEETSIADFVASLNSSPSQTCLDIAYDLHRAGCLAEAVTLLEKVSQPCDPMVLYTLGDFYLQQQRTEEANRAFTEAQSIQDIKTYAFRLEEKATLERVIQQSPNDSHAHYLLGCLLYDKCQYSEAATCWYKTIELDDDCAPAYRNLAIASYSHIQQKAVVLPFLKKALALDPGNDQLVYETLLVMGKLGVEPLERIQFVEEQSAQLASLRDDILLEWARALNQSQNPDSALALMQNQRFCAVEGGEHAVAEQYMFAHHLRGRLAMQRGDYAQALKDLRKAQVLPDNLCAGLWHEAVLVPHQFLEAICLMQLGDTESAQAIFRHILGLSIDYFSNMHLPELPVYQARCMMQMGIRARAEESLRKCLRDWSRQRKMTDPGFFGTTPFFISYIDSSEDAREAYFSYLIGHAKRALGDIVSAAQEFAECQKREPAKLYAWVECTVPVLESAPNTDICVAGNRAS